MEIIWRDVALGGLERAHRYIADHDPAAAERIFEAILAAVQRLPKMPNMGRPGRVDGTRELVVVGTPYLVVYSVIDNVLHIIAVQHGAREWPRRF
ncbi:MAG: type II toxin-antitoxin system RelE/ParE family toxin [Stellaceae bacterium]